MLVDKLRGDFRQPRDRASRSTSNSNEIDLNGKLHVMAQRRIAKFVLVETNQVEDMRRPVIATSYMFRWAKNEHLGQCFINYHTKQNYKS